MMRMARPAHYEATGARIDKLVVGPYENNVFVLRCRETRCARLERRHCDTLARLTLGLEWRPGELWGIHGRLNHDFR